MQSILNTRLKFILKTNFELIILQKINSNIKLSKRNKTWTRSFSQPKPKFLAFSHSICYSWIHYVDSKLIPLFPCLSLSFYLSLSLLLYLSLSLTVPSFFLIPIISAYTRVQLQSKNQTGMNRNNTVFSSRLNPKFLVFYRSFNGFSFP